MQPSETSRLAAWAHRSLSVLAHAGEVAQCLVQLLAWLWLGQQGMLHSPSLVGGVAAVAIWCALRVFCRGRAWVFQCPSVAVAASGALTACGVLWLGSAAASSKHAWSLMAVAGLWGLWSALTETRSPVRPFRPARMAWHPLLAAALLGVAWVLQTQGLVQARGLGLCTGLSLGLCAMLLYAREKLSGQRARFCKGSAARLAQLPAPSAMGLMMGTLFMGNAWCTAAAGPLENSIALHVALMASLPAMVGAVLRLRRWSQCGSAMLERACLALTALGALPGLAWSGAHGGLAMALLSLAWALHCNRPRPLQVAAAAILAPRLQRYLALLLGPGLLLAVGLSAQALGPQALALALAVPGAGAGLLLLPTFLAASRSHQPPRLAPAFDSGGSAQIYSRV